MKDIEKEFQKYESDEKLVKEISKLTKRVLQVIYRYSQKEKDNQDLETIVLSALLCAYTIPAVSSEISMPDSLVSLQRAYLKEMAALNLINPEDYQLTPGILSILPLKKNETALILIWSSISQALYLYGEGQPLSKDQSLAILQVASKIIEKDKLKKGSILADQKEEEAEPDEEEERLLN